MEKRLRKHHARRMLLEAMIYIHRQSGELDEMYAAIAARAQTDHQLAYLSEGGCGGREETGELA
jgi:hypothetical protein